MLYVKNVVKYLTAIVLFARTVEQRLMYKISTDDLDKDTRDVIKGIRNLFSPILVYVFIALTCILTIIMIVINLKNIRVGLIGIAISSGIVAIVLSVVTSQIKGNITKLIASLLKINSKSISGIMGDIAGFFNIWFIIAIVASVLSIVLAVVFSVIRSKRN